MPPPQRSAEELVAELGARVTSLRDVQQAAELEIRQYLAAPSQDARSDRQVLIQVLALLEQGARAEHRGISRVARRSLPGGSA